MWRNGLPQLQLTAFGDGAVAHQLIGDTDVAGQVGVVEVVADGDKPGLLVVAHHPGGTLDVLELSQPRVRDAIGRDQAVDAEVAVMDGLVVVAAIEVDRPSVRVGPRGNGVVAPLPHETTAHALVGQDDLPVVLEVAGPIAHGVAVLHQDEGLVRARVQVGADLI